MQLFLESIRNYIEIATLAHAAGSLYCIVWKKLISNVGTFDSALARMGAHEAQAQDTPGLVASYGTCLYLLQMTGRCVGEFKIKMLLNTSSLRIEWLLISI